MKRMILDGNSIINRAFYGVRPLSTRDGTPTHAVFGFLNILLKLVNQESPDALCVAFDLRAPTFRHQAYEGYKAQRKGMPEELAVQMPILKDVLGALNIPVYALEGWEADDLIGTAAAVDARAGWETVIVTGDKDSLQLVTDTVRVKLISTRMGQTTERDMTPEAFFEEYGFAPKKIVDLKALMGDASDNIPGVPGVGEKTALDLVRRFGALSAIYENLDGLDLKPAVRAKLAAGRDSAFLSFDLATIRTDAPVPLAPGDALRVPPDGEALRTLFLKLEFSKLLDRFDLTPPAAPPKEAAIEVTCTSEIVQDAARLDTLLAAWAEAPFVATLTTPDLSVTAVEADNHMAYLTEGGLGEDYARFLRVFFGGGAKKVTHSAKELCRRLLDEGVAVQNVLFDVALAGYLLAPTDGSYDMEKLFLAEFNAQLPPAKAYLDPEAFQPLCDPAPALGALGSHTAAAAALYEVQRPRLVELGLDALYDTVELPLCTVLAEMEQAGFRVDRAALARFGEMLTGRMEHLQREIHAHAGETFNINSTQQLGAVLFEKLGMPAMKKTKTGYSTGAEVLERLRGHHPIIDCVLEYRQLSKLNSTYVEGLSKVIAADGRIHTSFQNTVTATGRLSSTEPNLQNIPVRTELGAHFRNMFIAEPGHVLVDADYSQIELRLLAHMADDSVMIAAFNGGQDIHTITASQVFGVPAEGVTGEMRRAAKAVNFGIVYGISDFSLAQDIHVTRAEAKEYIERYLEKYAGVQSYMERVVEQAKKDGYVKTLMGRRRWLPELSASNFNLRSFGERVALNMPIQGTAADIMKLAMLRVRDRLRAEGLAGRLILQVHDELIVECPAAEAEQVKALLTEEMEGVMTLSVPLTAEAHAGASWAEAKG